MSSKIISAAVIGLKAQSIEVEVDATRATLHTFNIVGLPDVVVRESRDRVSAAIKNSGAKPPHHCGRVTVNLAPADLRKQGPAYDLPIAVGFLVATNQLYFDWQDKLFIGELALDGKIRHTNGILSVCLMAKRRGIKEVILPKVDAQEASLVQGIKIVPVENLIQLVDHLNGHKIIEPFPISDPYKFFEKNYYEVDMSYVKGQQQAKRALEIAAAGAHNMLMSGPPGSGKTLLSRTLPSILPSLTLSEALEVTQIYSVAGLLPQEKPLITSRPFRNPHHTASGAALVGGGAWPRPGEISLAHRGILFLDEFSEFPRQVLENLRQPLEDGIINVSRASGTLQFPARFTLVASQNPCPCGYLSDPEKECTCTSLQVIKYQKKVSGPLLDRIDLHIEVPRVDFKKLVSEEKGETSSEIRGRVQKAREIQKERFRNLKIVTNSEMGSEEVRKFCPLNEENQKLLKGAAEQFHFSARVYYRILKLARTIADLAQDDSIKTSQVAEALQYRLKVGEG